MKKIYILAIALTAFAFTGQSQEVDLEDDFDFYNLGDISAQAFHFRTWSAAGGAAEDADVVDTFASSGGQSMFVDDSGAVDMIMLIDAAPTSGVYDVQWNMYVPAGNSGYFNMQAAMTPADEDWAQALMGGNVYFNCGGGTPGEGLVSGGIDCEILDGDVIFAFPHDEWFNITCSYDLDAQTWKMYVNGTLQFADYPFEFGAQEFEGLIGIDFYSNGSTNGYYVDDLFLGTDLLLLGSQEFEATGFRSALNNNILTLRANEEISNVSIYNMLGQEVYRTSTNTSSINMSSYANGTYIVKVNIAGTEGTVKIVK